MKEFLREWLQCPACQGTLQWDVSEKIADRIETAEAQCRQCHTVYPVREGIGAFLLAGVPREDLWKQVDSNLVKYLRENPAIERQLLDSPLETLAPADQFFRALVLEERGHYSPEKPSRYHVP